MPHRTRYEMIRYIPTLLVVSAIIAACTTEAAAIPQNRQFRASWGGPSDVLGLYRGYWDSPVQLGVFAQDFAQVFTPNLG